MTKTLKVARVLKHFPKIKFQIYKNKALTTHHIEDGLVFLYLNVPFQLIQRLPWRDLPGPLKMVDHMNHTTTLAYTGIGLANTLLVQRCFQEVRVSYS